MENPKLTTDQRVRIVCEIIERGLHTEDVSIDKVCSENRIGSKTVRREVGEVVFNKWVLAKRQIRIGKTLKRVAELYEEFKKRIDEGEALCITKFCREKHVSYESLRNYAPAKEMEEYLKKANPYSRTRTKVKKRRSKFFQMPSSEYNFFIGNYLI